MNIGTLLYTWLCCKKAGTDQYGNCYYISKSPDAYGNYKRSVIYNGKVEASKIPPVWNAWLRYNNDQLPDETKSYHWQKDFIPNLTGTKNKYLPLGHLLQNEKRVEYSNKYYEPWKP